MTTTMARCKCLHRFGALFATFAAIALIVPATATIGATTRLTAGAGIKDAVMAASPGDTIVVGPGVYSEIEIVVDRPLTILGDGEAIIDARERGQILTLAADSVTVKGITFRNVGTSFMEDRAAIKILNAADCQVIDNVLENAFFGIYVDNSQRCVVRGNRIMGLATRESTSGNGIHLWHCIDITIEDNVVSGHRDGIYFEFVEKSAVRRNLSTGNLRYGLHFMFSHDDTYTDNVFKANGSGVAVMYSKGVVMARNRFEMNWGRSAYGLLLKEIKDSRITSNEFLRNTIAVYSEGSNRVEVKYNTFTENGYAVKIMANSLDNTFSKNNFFGNTFDVSTNSRQNFNTFQSNHWSDYRGYDLDHDGIGDVPHRPVRLFALLVERQPASVVLLNSLFVKLIDTAERVLPSFTPETLVDNEPLIIAVTAEERNQHDLD